MLSAAIEPFLSTPAKVSEQSINRLNTVTVIWESDVPSSETTSSIIALSAVSFTFISPLSTAPGSGMTNAGVGVSVGGKGVAVSVGGDVGEGDGSGVSVGIRVAVGTGVSVCGIGVSACGMGALVGAEALLHPIVKSITNGNQIANWKNLEQVILFSSKLTHV